MEPIDFTNIKTDEELKKRMQEYQERNKPTIKYQQTQTRKTELDDWAKKSLPILKKNGYLRNYLSQPKIILFICIWILTLIVFYYVGAKGFLSGDVNQNVNLEPVTNITNVYNFTPQTFNNYSFNPNHTIIINIPSNLCGGNSSV